MAKQVVTKIKLQVPGGQATPTPPVGPALAQNGVAPSEFINRFNEATRHKQGVIIPVVITVYADRSFDFTRRCPAQAGGRTGQGGAGALPGDRGPGHPDPARRDRPDQDGRPERCRRGGGRAHHRRHRPQYGPRGRRGLTDQGKAEPSW